MVDCKFLILVEPAEVAENDIPIYFNGINIPDIEIRNALFNNDFLTFCHNDIGKDWS